MIGAPGPQTNRLAAVLHPSITFAGHGDAATLYQTVNLHCGCSGEWALKMRPLQIPPSHGGLHWSWSLLWLCDSHGGKRGV